MKKFWVWCPDRGHRNHEEGSEIRLRFPHIDPNEAVEQWAADQDLAGSFEIVRTGAIEVYCRDTRRNVTRWLVAGSASYYASEIPAGTEEK
ncbi:MAG: hypothetical protein ABL912_01695 [Novosphingobium sp.]